MRESSEADGKGQSYSIRIRLGQRIDRKVNIT